ncbi:hypothetical protein INT47_007735 [Mucor saturninus]|uniref:Uncharacterized protein n=1 Tax=Mucor saturninus TaxID=64648 RepID=A0A8H7UY51_9FUNG|nr:hypothetical protein INT47_007735 [Mucor saturninus]
MQSDRYSLQNIEIRPVSAQYPPALKMTDNNYVPQLLNQTRFTIPFGLEEVRSFLIACLEKRCSTFSAPEVVGMMFGELDKVENIYNNLQDESSFNLDIEQMQAGMTDLSKKHMQEFNMSRDPIILPPTDRDTERRESPSGPIYFLNIDILSSHINVTVRYIDTNSQVKQSESIEWMNNLLKLKVPTPDLKSSKIRSDFVDHFTTKPSKSQSKEIRNLLEPPKSNLLGKATKNADTNELFASNDKSCSTDNNFMTTYDPAYMFCFLITYLHNFNKLLEEELQCLYRNNWQKKNMWYGVSVDKNLLDTVFGSKKNLKKLFIASGIIRKDDNLRKSEFCTRGEEILPAIQQKLGDLVFKMKSYFVVAHVFSKRIQLTLHQVVKLATSKKDASTIVIHEKIISIDDVYDTLCKEIWKTINYGGQINYCAAHLHDKHEENDLRSFETCSTVLQKLKLLVVKLLSENKTSLDMDSKKELRINDKCTCSINIFLRDIIEVGMNSVINCTSTSTVASLTNKELFGNYEVDYLFMLGDPFHLSHGSLIHNAYSMITQQVVGENIHLKERNVLPFILRESILKLLEVVTQIKPYMYESSDDVKNTIQNDGKYLVFIQKGKPIPTTGLMIKMMVDSVDRPWTEIIKVKHSSDALLVKDTLLDEKSQTSKYRMRPKGQECSDQKLIIECKHLNYNNSVQLSVRMMGSDVSYNQSSYKDILIIGEPLTLAYT